MFHGYSEFKQNLHNSYLPHVHQPPRARVSSKLAPKQAARCSVMLSEREFRKFLARITSSTERIFYLSGRMIINERFVQLLQAISTVKDQREIALHLSNNRITDSGLEQALAYIQESTRLITIDLSFNQVSDTGVSKLLEVIQNNVFIRKLNLLGNSIQSGILDQVELLMERNQAIHDEHRRMPYYLAAAILCRIAGFPREISCLMFDHICEATNVQARAYLSQILYPQVIHRVEQLSSSQLESISLASVFDMSFKNELEKRALKIQDFYGRVASNVQRGDAEQDEDSRQEFVPLLRVQSKGVRGVCSNSSIELQESGEKHQSSPGCCIVL